MGNAKYLRNDRHATWLELFFDLIFVVALGKVTHLLAYTHQQQLEAGAFPRFFILFIPFWWIWVLHTSFSNRFDSDNRFHRILTLLLMFVLIILSTTLDAGAVENFLIKSDKDKNGTGIVYSQLLIYMSFSILANTIRHAILQDLDLTQFRIMAISGMLLLYIGKQTAYAINVPKHNKNRILNSLIALSFAAASLLMAEDRYILLGMALSFAVYIVANYKMQMKFYGKVNF